MPMKQLLFFLSGTLIFFAANAQSNYTEAMQKGDEAFSKGQYKAAINKYFAAEAFDPSKKDTVRKKVNNVFIKIEALRKKAEDAEKAATKAKKEADAAKDRAIRSDNNTKNALDKVTKTKDAFRLITIARQNVNKDPTIALRIAEAAMDKEPDSLILSEAEQIFHHHSFYKTIADSVSIKSAAISPDGTKILTGGYDGILRLWNIDGSLIRKFKQLQEPIMSVAFSPDGTKILTGGYDHVAILWKEDGSIVRNFKGHRSPIISAAFSPDGTKILTGGSYDHIARLWDTSGTLVKEYVLEGESILSVNFLPDSKNILVSTDKATWKWNTEKEENTKNTVFPIRDITAVFSRNGEIVLIGTKNDTTGLFDFQGNSLIEFRGASTNVDEIVSAAFSTDGERILTGTKYGIITLWTKEGYLIKEFKGHSRSVYSLAFSPGGENFLSWSADGTIKRWATDEALVREVKIKNSGGTINFITLSPDGTKILTATKDQTLELWSTDGKRLQKFSETQGEIKSMSFSSDGKNILIYLKDSVTSLWSLDGTKIAQFSGSCVSYSPDGKTIFTGSSDGIVRLLNMEGSLIKEFKPHDTCAISSIAFSRDGNKVLTGCDNSTISLWSKEGSLKWRLKVDDSLDSYYVQTGIGKITSLIFSRDGKKILVGLYRKWVLLNTEGAPIREFRGTHSSFAFSDDGNKILFWEAYSVTLFDLTADVKLWYRMEGIQTAAFSPDGEKIITGSRDGIIRYWNTAMTLKQFLRSNKIDALTEKQREEFGIK